MVAGSITAAFLGSFCGSLVECVEALTVVLAIGSVRGWRPALAGAAGALLVLAAIVAAFGPALGVLELPALRVGVGSLLLLFGLRWLRKAILRAAGVLPLHDEAREFAEIAERMRKAAAPGSVRWDGGAVAASFHIVMLEGIEVVFIVTAVGTRQSPAAASLLEPAILGAAGAAAVVIALGLALHRPLARIPENALKLGVSVLLSGFGLFWIGEGLGLAWPGADTSLLLLMAGFGALAFGLIGLCRRAAGRAATRPDAPARVATSGPAAVSRAARPRGPLALLYKKLIALFVDDRVLAIGVIAWIAAVAVLVGRLPFSAAQASVDAQSLSTSGRCTLLAMGPALLLCYRTVRAATVIR